MSDGIPLRDYVEARYVPKDELVREIADLKLLIGIERSARERAEGAVSVWRFIAAILGLPGIGALLIEITRH